MTATAYQFRKALATDSTATSLAAKAPTTTAPSGDGIHHMFDEGYGFSAPLTVCVPDSVVIQPFGTDAADETMLMELWGWNKVYAEDLYLPQLLIQVTATLGNIAEGSTDTYIADTIAITSNYVEADTSRTFNITPANDDAASIEVPIRGCEWIEFSFSRNSSSATNNAYWRPVFYK